MEEDFEKINQMRSTVEDALRKYMQLGRIGQNLRLKANMKQQFADVKRCR